MNLFNTATTLAASDPVAHVIDHSIVGDYFISNVTLMLVIASVVTVLIITRAAKKIATGDQRQTVDDFRAQGPLANFVELVCLFLRDNVFRQIFGDQTDKYIPILWTFFWFILVCNILGLIPMIDLTGGVFHLNHGHGYWGTATQSIWVTGALALIAGLLINVTGLMKDPAGYFKHLTGGAPIFMWPIIVPVEVLGIVIKPFALAIRLFANMTGGHILLAVLFSFVPALIENFGKLGGGALAIIPILGAVGIYLLELLVAFIQAFVFTFLTGLFLGQLVVHHHDDHGHDEAHDPAH